MLKENWTTKWTKVSPSIQTNEVYSLFTIDVELFVDGMWHLDDVIEVVFSYLRLNLQKLKQSDSLQQLYRDFVNVKNLPLFHERLPKQSVEHLLAQALMWNSESETNDEFDPVAIHDAIDALNERNFNIIVFTRRKYDKSIEFELKDGNCRLEYSVRKMPGKWISLWNNPKMFSEINLPSPNPYIANDFTILYNGSQSVPEYPTKVYENDVSELWFRQDDKFLVPTARCHFHLKSTTMSSPDEK